MAKKHGRPMNDGVSKSPLELAGNPVTNRTSTLADDMAPARTTRTDDAFRLVKTRLPIVVIITVLAAMTAWLLASMQPARYRASALAAVTLAPRGLSPDEQMRAIESLDRRTVVATAAALASSPDTIQSALAAAGAEDATVRAFPLPNTNLLRVEVEDGDAARAAAIANRVPALAGQKTTAIFRFYDLSVVAPAAAGEKIFPRPERAAAAGVVIGLLLGIGVAWALEKLRPRTA